MLMAGIILFESKIKKLTIFSIFILIALVISNAIAPFEIKEEFLILGAEAGKNIRRLVEIDPTYYYFDPKILHQIKTPLM